jgi:hypothetical protein
MMPVLRCAAGRTPVYSAPKKSAPLETELIYGQLFQPMRKIGRFIEGETLGFIRLKNGPVSKGYVRAVDLAPVTMAADYKISALQASVFAREDIKSQIMRQLPFGARIAVISKRGDFVKIGRGQYLHRQHCALIETYEDDFVAAAERHMGLPYIWGGVSSDGLDCSGLVQSALWAAGQSCPRNSGEQQAILGRKLETGAALTRGDLVFWPGHVGIMQDAAHIIHANAFHMCTASEPLNVAAQRIEKSAGPIIAIKRL